MLLLLLPLLTACSGRCVLLLLAVVRLLLLSRVWLVLGVGASASTVGVVGPAMLLVPAPVSVLLGVSRPSAMVLLVAPSCGAVGLAVAAWGRALLVHGTRGSHRLAGRVLVLRVVPAPVGRPLLVVAVALGARVVAAGGPTLAVAVVGAVAPRAVLTVSMALPSSPVAVPAPVAPVASLVGAVALPVAAVAAVGGRPVPRVRVVQVRDSGGLRNCALKALLGWQLDVAAADCLDLDLHGHSINPVLFRGILPARRSHVSALSPAFLLVCWLLLARQRP